MANTHFGSELTATSTTYISYCGKLSFFFAGWVFFGIEMCSFCLYLNIVYGNVWWRNGWVVLVFFFFCNRERVSKHIGNEM